MALKYREEHSKKPPRRCTDTKGTEIPTIRESQVPFAGRAKMGLVRRSILLRMLRTQPGTT
ncbi:hypothetical protein [Vulcanisaeta souniana]|uniref:hypothetical protein n=1 Tax=Vulcanisaeta souniana TaxID=164452 RepID=UPI001FB3BE11|nr:hypothetical protein [Vulcanisaeta souniana]